MENPSSFGRPVLSRRVSGKGELISKTRKPATAGILTVVAGTMDVLLGIGSMARREFVHRMIAIGRLGVLGIFLPLPGVVSVIRAFTLSGERHVGWCWLA